MSEALATMEEALRFASQRLGGPARLVAIEPASQPHPQVEHERMPDGSLSRMPVEVTVPIGLPHGADELGTAVWRTAIFALAEPAQVA